ncbi:hypothetical protein VRU48_11875 [Pedobacter sp. KR3-3]|uniref:Outer membrane lipoprotein-sorting protein n=1 Tax=Pedobacter albus TaxID=3113905 RepID=A0ABU7I8K3_9SPHI|nr:hypothetical protein [Pedobacter sp. KR3-3]MEE1945809.1 hypothetical protein [Pedobacter sp. KR3-3]
MSKLQRTRLFCVIMALIFGAFNTGAQTLSKDFREIHQKFYGKWPKTITFTQQTGFYKADTLNRTQTWYEAGIFPRLFRIDFGEPKEGNSVIYRGDTAYNFRQGKASQPVVNPNILIYLLGGMYYDKADEVFKKLGADGFDLSKSYRTIWNGHATIVFGTASADSSKSQLWFDAKDHYLVRMIQQKEKSRLECHFAKHQLINKIWHETEIKIFANNKLVQTEAYHDFKTNVPLTEAFFEPTKYGTWHWLKQ